MISDHQRNALTGTWVGEEQLLPTAWTDAGTAYGTISIANGQSGALVIDYHQKRSGETMAGLGVLFGDKWWWFDTYGFVPSEPGRAIWQHGELLLERRSDRGRTVTTLGVKDGNLVQRIDTAVPADGPLRPLLRGVYGRRDELLVRH